MAFDAFPVTIQTMTITAPLTTIYYPSVISLSNLTVQQKINRTISNEVQQLINRQRDPQQAALTEMTGNYEVKTNERNVLSLSLSNYAYVYHSAHGLTIIKSLTFNVSTGKSYTLKELFKPGSDYVKVLSDIIKDQLTTLDFPLLEEFNEIRPDQDYYIADKALVIYFQLYEITPYDVGLPAFPISRKNGSLSISNTNVGNVIATLKKGEPLVPQNPKLFVTSTFKRTLSPFLPWREQLLLFLHPTMSILIFREEAV